MSGAGCRVACAYLPRFRAIAYRTAISYLCTAGRRWRRGPAALLGRFLPRLRAAPSGVAFFVCRARAGRQYPAAGSSGTGSLTVRYPAMKHPHTILATTAIAVLGLGVAAQSFRANIDTAQAGPSVMAAPSINPLAWTDPPPRSGVFETTGTLALAPPKPLVVAAIPPAPVTAPVEPPRRAVATRRGKGSQRARLRAAHLRRAAPARTAAMDPAAPPRPESRPARNRIDPIGDILRGLGFGRDS